MSMRATGTYNLEINIKDHGVQGNKSRSFMRHQRFESKMIYYEHSQSHNSFLQYPESDLIQERLDCDNRLHALIIA